MAKVIAISNQKGGVGKTTTAVNLSSCLTVLEKKVLLIDLDPQANATSSLGIEKDIIENGIYKLFEKSSSVSDCIHQTAIINLDIIPSHIDLVGIEIESIDLIDREQILMNAINKIEEKYDYIIIDCPPSLGLLTMNALTTSNSVIIPIQCEYFAIEGLGKLLNTIKSIQKIHNKNLSIEGVLLTMYDPRLKLSNQVKKEVKLHFSEMVFKTIIHRNIKLGEAPSHVGNILDYDASNTENNNYLSLARELILNNS